ncbi:unnamed protein product [Notodromas monacha]|uniref:Uncharacterized protein n=1 Tax=Notodromas monacha TaxID=399045 RepID=A0A7R9BHM4_9CRUS|nr:unnamed protein product [Notodromas monacha]CAG0914253.1 unnamed protein product [Notodromas monacha]
MLRTAASRIASVTSCTSGESETEEKNPLNTKNHSMDDTSAAAVDTSPFTAENLWMLGRRDNWPRLREIIRPLSALRDNSKEEDGFFVTSAAKQALIDDLRMRMDSSKDADTGMNLVYETVSFNGGDDGELLKLILSIGLDPDVAKKYSWRPLHVCASYARPAAAQEDSRNPERTEDRPKVASAIMRFVSRGFPSLAQLAAEQEWFAVLNLMRRRVLSKKEFKEKFDGKTVAEWALTFDKPKLAAEIAYYKKLASFEQKQKRNSVIDRFRSSLKLSGIRNNSSSDVTESGDQQQQQQSPPLHHQDAAGGASSSSSMNQSCRLSDSGISNGSESPPDVEQD